MQLGFGRCNGLAGLRGHVLFLPPAPPFSVVVGGVIVEWAGFKATYGTDIEHGLNRRLSSDKKS